MNGRSLSAWSSALVAAGLGAIGMWGQSDFCLDDAYIHLDYALSLKLGQGLSYNPGDFETGSSSPLWALLLALWPWGGEPLVSVKLLGVVLHACTAGVAAQLASALLVPPSSAMQWRVGLCAGVLVAAEPSLLVSSTSGMEVSLTSALLACAVLCELRGRERLGFVAAGLATLSRPEALCFLAAYGVLRGVGRHPRALWLSLGAAVGLGVWVLYCLTVSGFPWPNTKYVKSTGLSLEGLSFLAAEVLPMQPWLVGVGGVVLLVRAVLPARAGERSAIFSLLGAFVLTLLAIAISRHCPPGTQFYTSRYFAIVAWVPLVPIALGLGSMSRWLAALCLCPVVLVNWQLTASALALQHHQAGDIRQLHSEPARFIAQSLPADAVVVVEGAGAARFYTPRSMQILDMIGLNDRAIAHAGSDRERLCSLLARRPTHLLVPDSLLSITVPLQVTLERRFTDPDYRITRTAIQRSVQLLSVHGLKPKWSSFCDHQPSR
jgi:hypothetical protein